MRGPSFRAATAAVVAGWALALGVQRSLRRVRGRSMAPTLEPGDLVLVVPTRRPRRGTVVLVRDPRDPSRTTVKRLVGLPHETVRLRRGVLVVDGVAVDDRHAVGAGPDAELAVPADHVVVLGDHRAGSTDSRVFGAVHVGAVTGRVVARLAPAPRRL